jgi:predicted dienelactone hydrolase
MTRRIPDQLQRVKAMEPRIFATRVSLAILLGSLLMGAISPAETKEVLYLPREDGKTLAAMAYAPQGTCRGVAVISPGAGGSEQGQQHLGTTMSALGYLTVVVGHQESGRSALRARIRGQGLRAGLAELVQDPAAYRGRLMDVSAAKEWASERCHAVPALLIGHSMGAATAMLEAGARNHVRVRGSDRFDAYIALSPQGIGPIFPDEAWSTIQKPVLLLTGTRDKELGGASWESRTEPFENLPSNCKWLGVIAGAGHMDFGGNGNSSSVEEQTSQVIGAFIAGVNRGDCSEPPRIPGMDLRAK